jgi:hypothetical protein
MTLMVTLAGPLAMLLFSTWPGYFLSVINTVQMQTEGDQESFGRTFDGAG